MNVRSVLKGVERVVLSEEVLCNLTACVEAECVANKVNESVLCVELTCKPETALDEPIEENGPAMLSTKVCC